MYHVDLNYKAVLAFACTHTKLIHDFIVFLDTPTGGYMSEDQCSDMSGDQPQSMQTGG